MALTKAKKKEIIEKVGTALKQAVSIVFVNFKKIPVSETTTLRRDLRSKNANYVVVKKTLLRRVLEDLGIAGDLPELGGEVAVAYGDDPVLPAKAVSDFRKTREEKLAILGGVFEGKYLAAHEMQALANIPTRHTLLGMFANVINSPVSGLVIALDAIAKTKPQE